MTCLSPSRLPLAPRPLPDEIISSWLLRVAAANAVTLSDLLAALESQHPRALEGVQLLDCAAPHSALAALASFCRVPIRVLEPLDLQRRAPCLEPRLLLQFPCPLSRTEWHRYRAAADSPWRWSRALWIRVRYAHCPVCLGTQTEPHIRWEWCFAGLVDCPLHQVDLQDGCPHCGEMDPLHFGPPDEPGPVRCSTCQTPLGTEERAVQPRSDWEAENAVTEAYRAALRGVAPHPRLVGRATSREFRRFVHDVLDLLGESLAQPPTYPSAGLITRQDLLTIVGDLVRTAAPSVTDRQRRARAARSLVLWDALLTALWPWRADSLEALSRRWPLAIRRRLASAVLWRTRHCWRNWPGSSRALNTDSLPIRCRNLSAACGLPTRVPAPQRRVV